MLISCLCVFSCCFARSQHTSSLHQSISTYASQTGFDGAVLVAEGDSLIYRHAFGARHRQSGAPFTLTTPSYVASLTKQMISALVLQLVERGEWRLSDPIGWYLRELPPWARGLTIRQLLCHQSGLPEYAFYIQNYNHFTNQRVFTILGRCSGLNFTPGAAFSYSNTGYVLLAEALSWHYQQPIEAVMQCMLFDELEMNLTFVIHHDTLQRHSERAFGTFSDGRWGDIAVHCIGDGGTFSTVSDLWRWQRALFSGQIISDSTLKLAYAPQHLNDNSPTTYGLGWFLSKYGFGMSPRAKAPQPLVVHHYGQSGGFRSYLGHQPDTGRTIIIVGCGGITSYQPLVERIERALGWGG